MLIDSQIVKVPNIVNINAMYIKIEDLYRETLQLGWPQAPGRQTALPCLMKPRLKTQKKAYDLP